ncbi:MAG: Ig-like domain-containing protein [Gemmatimonadaceae bacterium]|nr:Ig-like domain-containing protein [Gemmatimonadaceae bacterium]
MVLVACQGSDPVSSTAVAAVQVTTPTGALRPGQTSQFTAVAVNAYGYEIAGAGSVTWISSAPLVASVNESGLVSALAGGTASISATIQGVTGTRVVTVVPVGTGAIVTMAGNSFIPFEVFIRVGEPVYFEFPQLAHNVIFNAAAGAPADIQQTRNATVARTFGTAGRFLYDCTLHPGMTGAVTVNP